MEQLLLLIGVIAFVGALLCLLNKHSSGFLKTLTGILIGILVIGETVTLYKLFVVIMEGCIK